VLHVALHASASELNLLLLWPFKTEQLYEGNESVITTNGLPRVSFLRDNRYYSLHFMTFMEIVIYSIKTNQQEKK